MLIHLWSAGGSGGDGWSSMPSVGTVPFLHVTSSPPTGWPSLALMAVAGSKLRSRLRTGTVSHLSHSVGQSSLKQDWDEDEGSRAPRAHNLRRPSLSHVDLALA